MKWLTYVARFLLLLFGLLCLVIYWPKGSLEEQLQRHQVPAIAYGIIEDGKLNEWQVIGELSAGEPAPNDAIFNVASVTKPVFATTVLKLIAAGELELDEPLYPYWVDPDIVDDPRHRQLTARILLSHQAGFPNWRWNTETGKLAFEFDPGARYQYSGEGFEYLRLAIELKMGKSWSSLADSLIFQPLNMPDSRLIWDSLMPEDRFAKWHNREGGRYETQKRTDAVASDDLMTTVSDYTHFLQHIINGADLPSELFAEMSSAQVMVNERAGYGLGWEVIPNMKNGESALVHGGADMGVRTRVVVMPESGQGFIAFTNSDGGQKLIDRLMVERFGSGKELIRKLYAPVVWRIIYLPYTPF